MPKCDVLNCTTYAFRDGLCAHHYAHYVRETSNFSHEFSAYLQKAADFVLWCSLHGKPDPLK